jgi:hypothetical protein
MPVDVISRQAQELFEMSRAMPDPGGIVSGSGVVWEALWRMLLLIPLVPSWSAGV